MVRKKRVLDWLKRFQRIATRYDKIRKSFEAFLSLATVKI